MATVTGKTADKIQEIEDAGIASAGLDSDGHLRLTRNDSTVIDAGSMAAPTGSVVMFAASIIPSGWLLCKGQAVSRIDYADLFTLIGTAYGIGDGSSTFNLPNLEARFPRMEAGNLAGQGGSAAAHSHLHTDHSHDLNGGSPQAVAHVSVNPGGANPSGWIERIAADDWTANMKWQATSSADDTGSNRTYASKVVGMTAAGGNDTQATTVTPPYLNLNFIIKA